MHDALSIARRRLIKNTGSTVIIVLLVTMAVAGTASVFAVVESLLYKPLSYPAEQHLATLTTRLNKLDNDSGLSVPYLDTIREARWRTVRPRPSRPGCCARTERRTGLR